MRPRPEALSGAGTSVIGKESDFLSSASPIAESIVRGECTRRYPLADRVHSAGVGLPCTAAASTGASTRPAKRYLRAAGGAVASFFGSAVSREGSSHDPGRNGDSVKGCFAVVSLIPDTVAERF